MNRTGEPVPRRMVRETENHEISLLTATLNLYKNHHTPLQEKNYENISLLDTGAFRIALSEIELRRSFTAHNPEVS